MKKSKKLISLLLALTMLLSIIPMAVAADGTIVKDGVTLYTTTKPRYFTFLRNNAEGNVTKNVGQSGVYQRLPRYTNICSCGRTLVECIPDEYSANAQNTVELGNPTVLKDLSYTISGWKNNDEYKGDPCLTFNFTAAKPGKTTVKLTFYYNYNFDGASGTCKSCGRYANIPAMNTWLQETTTFTVTVTGDSGEDEKPDVTVTYTDGVEDEEVFKDQVYTVKVGDPTPAFEGGEPTRAGYKFLGWEPAVAETVTGNAVYTAQWELETYTITYDYRGVVKQADVRDAGNPENFTIKDLPIKLNPAKFKNNEWPQKFLNWRDAEGNVVTEITKPGDITLYAYYQYPVRYRVYDEDGKEVEALTVIDWYNEDDFASYEVRPATVDMPGYELDGWYQDLKDAGNVNKRFGSSLYMAKKYELVGKLSCCINVTVEVNGETVNEQKFTGAKGGTPDYRSLYSDIVISAVADGSLVEYATYIDGERSTGTLPVFGTNANVKIVITTAATALIG